MWGHGISVVLFMFSLLYLMNIPAGADIDRILWKDVSGGVTEPDLRLIAVDPSLPDTVYISTYNTVYKTVDDGNIWKEVLSFRGTGNGVTTIMTGGGNPAHVFVGTKDGLYRSIDGGLTWQRIFKGVGDRENSVLSLGLHPDIAGIIYIGTGAGIFTTSNSGMSWEKIRTLPAGDVISSIAIIPSAPNVMYAGTDDGIYKSMNSGAGWKRTYGKGGDTGVEEGAEEIDDTPDLRIRTITVNPGFRQTVYAGTSEGLLITENGGLTWKAANSLGLISRDIRHVTIVPSDPDGVYAATGRGVFRYSMNTGIWEELYKGLTSRDIRYLAAGHGDSPSGMLWAVTKSGVFRTDSAGPPPGPEYNGKKAEDVMSIFAHEPEIGDVLRAAIEYADVHPGKIEGWKKAALNRAWLPELEFDYGKGRDWQSDRYYYSGEYVDNDITKGRDESWSVSLTWELGKLIWNDDQTSEIDKRSEATVELRDDILNEVTRLYYERRRLKAAMILSPRSDIQKKIDNELRLQELTAGIDALTGSYFSERLGAGPKERDMASE